MSESTPTTETFEFQTEARQLLDLMIHSVYSNKDIFLRELISNASDALDKRRFEGVKHPDILPEGTELHIRLEPGHAPRSLAIVDNGIGMSRAEVQELIGTIAKSGTREFLRQAKEAQASGPELIGQFGVGFYSVFMVAERVTLLTRRAGEDEATLWESSGDGKYTLTRAERSEPGTTITLYLKPEDSENGLHDYTAEWTLRNIVKQYSDFVAYPIRMDIERTERERDADGNVIEGAEEKKVVRTETLNSMKAIWLRDKAEVTEDEYNEFYKHIAHDWTDPMLRIQAKIEGTMEYRLLLYVPSHAPMDLYYAESRNRGVHLYIKRVFIMDDCRDLLPGYLRFLRGVVDSEDLSLNISREILQQDRQIQRMSKGIVGKALAALKDFKEKKADEYLKFWGEFGRVLKEGLFQDEENRERLLDLALFSSTHDGSALTSLKDYVERMKEGQEAIYYITGEDRKRAENSPHLEAFRAKGYEVLLLVDPVDEVWAQSVSEYADKPLRSIAKGAAELGTEEEKKLAEEELKEKSESFAPLLGGLKSALGDQVKDVRLSTRLTESAACLVTDTHDLSPQLEQMMRAMGQPVPPAKRILELNPGHDVIVKLRERAEAGAEGIGDYAELLYGQALLAEGGTLDDPAGFAKRVSTLLAKAL